MDEQEGNTRADYGCVDMRSHRHESMHVRKHARTQASFVLSPKLYLTGCTSIAKLHVDLLETATNAAAATKLA